LRSWCAERVSDYKVPETVTVSAEPLPRNANGKVMKRQLREALPP
jgi:long-chain acyl-CoA synthetase